MTSEEVNSAEGSAPARSEKTKTTIDVLNEKRAALNIERERYATARSMRDENAMATSSQRLDALRTIILELEREAAVEVEAAGRKAAEERQLGIRRAAGSVRAELKEDDKRVRELEKELNEVNAKRTTRARKYETLQAESDALSDRFSIPPVKLESVAEPPAIEVPTPWQHRVVRPSFEQCEHNLRERRDYAELGGTPGYAIIQVAGLKAFRPLTEREGEVLEDRTERKPDPVLAAAAVEANALGKLNVPRGGVFHG